MIVNVTTTKLKFQDKNTNKRLSPRKVKKVLDKLPFRPKISFKAKLKIFWEYVKWAACWKIKTTKEGVVEVTIRNSTITKIDRIKSCTEWKVYFILCIPIFFKLRDLTDSELIERRNK